MRIISGKYRGKRISAPKNLPVRPTTDMAKEGIFNILTNEFSFENLVILDLFSGTGNIAYEFASRGVKSIVAVDLNYGCTSFIKSTSAQLGFDQISVVRSDVDKFIHTTHGQFSIIYADPPYDLVNQEKLIEKILAGTLLKPGGWLIWEHDEHHNFSELEGFTQQRRYGSVNFTIFAKS
jgi:16S rRNA (guanine(966)-N(2))-methyltransferase RsmD